MTVPSRRLLRLCAVCLALLALWPLALCAQRPRMPYVAFLPPLSQDSVWDCAATGLVPVVYKVNKFRLYPNAQLDSIVRAIVDARADSSLRFRYVYVGGSASPEGPVWWNKDLGRYRSEALARYLRRNAGLALGDMRVENLAEDWGATVRTLRDTTAAAPAWLDRGRVLGIIASEPDWARRKAKIRAIDRGRTWRWMVGNWFPPYRNSRLAIVCDWRPEAVPAAAIPAAAPALAIPELEVPDLPAPRPRRLIAVKTNLAFAAALVANAGVEVELWPRWSIDLPIYYSPYDITALRRVRLLGAQPELRRWAKAAGEGWFAGAHATVLGFNVSRPGHPRYQDPNRALWGLGIGGGWATHLDRKKHWGLEANVGFGFAKYSYDTYRNEGHWRDEPILWRGNKRTWWGPTRFGLTIGYQWHPKRGGTRR